MDFSSESIQSSSISYILDGNSVLDATLITDGSYSFQIYELMLSIEEQYVYDVSGTLTATLSSHLGPRYDVVYLNQDMSCIYSLSWNPANLILDGSDYIKFYWDNAGNVEYGLRVSTCYRK